MRYSNITLIKVTKAIKKDPRAIEPQWYLIDHQTAYPTLYLPFDSVSSLPWPEKYHMQAVAEVEKI
jgi:hypothetical protein